MEERFQNEKQRGSLEAAGRPADSAPSPLWSPRLSFSVFLSLYFGARAGAAAPARGLRQKRFPLAFRIPTDPRFLRGCPRRADSPQFCSAPGGPRASSAGAPQRAAGDGLVLNEPGLGCLSGSQPQSGLRELRWALQGLQAPRPDPPASPVLCSRLRLARRLRAGESGYAWGSPAPDSGCFVVATKLHVRFLMICI